MTTASNKTKPDLIGKRIEIPAHYDLWMQGARYGKVTGFRNGSNGASDCFLVKMDHPQVKRTIRLPRLDWDYIRVVGQ